MNDTQSIELHRNLCGMVERAAAKGPEALRLLRTAIYDVVPVPNPWWIYLLGGCISRASAEAEPTEQTKEFLERHRMEHPTREEFYALDVINSPERRRWEDLWRWQFRSYLQNAPGYRAAFDGAIESALELGDASDQYDVAVMYLVGHMLQDAVQGDPGFLLPGRLRAAMRNLVIRNPAPDESIPIGVRRRMRHVAEILEYWAERNAGGPADSEEGSGTSTVAWPWAGASAISAALRISHVEPMYAAQGGALAVVLLREALTADPAFVLPPDEMTILEKMATHKREHPRWIWSGPDAASLDDLVTRLRAREQGDNGSTGPVG